ncbi:MAG: tetratricopeptide repeat protein [Deltaproteobacteria bacterium]|nr:tetratricopeptide repeat protein [Deltaproteobacteria bacterium]
MHIKTGIAYLNAGKHTSALKEFMDAESIMPNEPEVHYYLGTAYHGKGLGTKAENEFIKALALKTDYSEANNYLGTIYLQTKRYDEAVVQFKAALSNVLYETPSVAYYNLGTAYYYTGAYDDALAAFGEAVKKDPSGVLLPLIYKNIGLVHLDRNNLSEAIGAFNRSLEIASSIVETHYWLGISYLRKGDRYRAVREFQRALEINPKSIHGIKSRDELNRLGIK